MQVFLTAALLQDTTLVLRWTEHTKADEVAKAIPYLDCGTNMAARMSVCSYCGWSYGNDPRGCNDWHALPEGKQE